LRVAPIPEDVINRMFSLSQREKIRKALNVPVGRKWNYALQRICDELNESLLTMDIQKRDPIPKRKREICDQTIKNIESIQRLIWEDWFSAPFRPLVIQQKSDTPRINSVELRRSLDDLKHYLSQLRKKIPRTKPPVMEPTGLAYSLAWLYDEIHDRPPKKSELLALAKAVLAGHPEINTSQGLEARCKAALREVKRELALGKNI